MKTFGIYALAVLSFGYIHNRSHLTPQNHQLSSTNNYFNNNFQLNSGILNSYRFEEKDTALTSLNLSGNQLKNVPSYLSKLKDLNYLSLSDNPELSILNGINQLIVLNKLQTLQLEDCNLTYIPYRISEIPSLRFLNLSNNHIVEIPYELAHLEKLEYIDLSDNDLRFLKYAPSLWNNLKSINLKNNPNLNHEEAFFVLSFIQNTLNKIEVSDVDTLPDMIKDVKCKEVVFENSLLNGLDKIAENKVITSINIDKCNGENINKSLENVKFDSTLKNLSINNSLTSFSNLVRFPGINTLDLSENNFKSNPLILKRTNFPQLKELNIKNSELTEENISELKKEFPNVKIVTGNEQINSPKQGQEIKPLADHLKPQPQSQTIDPDKKQTLEFNSVSLKIPKNALVDSKGNPINEPVSIAVTEYNNPAETILGGIPMTYDSAGITYNFESGGMMNIEASTQSGKNVFIDPKKPVQINVKSSQTDNNYSLYQMDTSDAQWEYINSDISIQSNLIADTADVTKEDYNNYMKANYPGFYKNPPSLSKENYVLDLKTIKKYDKMQTPIRLTYAYNYSAFKLRFKNTVDLLNKNLYYDGNFSQFKKDIRKFYRMRDQKYSDIKSYFAQRNITLDSTINYTTPWSFELKVNHQNDNFDLVIAYPDSIMATPVDLRTKSNPEQDQKQYQRFWKKYKRAIAKDERENQKVLISYKKALDKYDEEMEEFQEIMRKRYQYSAPNFSQYKIERSFSINRFGMFNCDRFARGQKVEANIKIKNLGKKVIIPAAIYVINRITNGFSKHFGNSIFYGKNEKNSLTIITQDNKIGIISEDEFDFANKDIKYKTLNFETQFYDIDSVSKEQLVNMILG